MMDNTEQLARVMYEALEQGAAWEGLVQDAAMDQWCADIVEQWRKSARAVIAYQNDQRMESNYDKVLAMLPQIGNGMLHEIELECSRLLFERGEEGVTA